MCPFVFLVSSSRSEMFLPASLRQGKNPIPTQGEQTNTAGAHRPGHARGGGGGRGV